MRIQKEIDNIERVKDKTAVMPLTMEDAIQFHKKVIDKIEKDRKEANKAMGVGDIEKDGFTGASKTPQKTTTPELKKMKLSEARFADYAEDKKKLSENLDYDGHNRWGDDVEKIMFPILEELFKVRFEIFFGIRGEYTRCDKVAELVQYLTGVNEKLAKAIETLDANKTHIQESLITNYLVEDWDDYIAEIEQEEEEKARAEKEQADKEKARAEREKEDQIRKDERIRADERRRQQAKDERRRRRAEAHRDATTGEKQRRRAAAQAELERRAAEEEEQRKAEEERRQQIQSQVTSERDWVREREEARRQGRNIDFTGYSEEEQQAVKDYLDDFDTDETKQTSYLRKYQADTEQKAKEAAEKRREEEKQRHERRLSRTKEISQTVADTPNRIKSKLGKLGINLKF